MIVKDSSRLDAARRSCFSSKEPAFMHAIFRYLCIAALVYAASGSASAQSPLSKDIDRLVQEQLDKAKVPSSPRSDDAEFLRRIYLDITGRIPTYEQAVSFLASTEADKRA